MPENQERQPTTSPQFTFERNFGQLLLMTRRHFLKLLTLTTLAGLTACSWLRPNQREPEGFQKSRDKEAVPNEFLELGDAEQVPLHEYGVQWGPDGQICYVTFADGKRTYFISGNARTFAFTEDRRGNFVPRDKNERNRAIPCYGPHPAETYRNGYGSITSVLQIDPENLDHLLGITHNEQWAAGTYANYTGSIGLVESQDRGVTWNNHGQVLKAADAWEPGTKVTGVGQPSAILKTEADGRQFVYVYYLYLPGREGEPYLIHLSRAPLQNQQLGDFEHFTENGFQGGIEINPDTVKPVMPAPRGVDTYTALPNVSFNQALGKYAMVFETQQGFRVATSDDAITWGEPELVFQFPQGQYPHTDGQRWYSNPNLWSPDLPNSLETSAEGYLICSRGRWPDPHFMERRRFRLKQ